MGGWGRSWVRGSRVGSSSAGLVTAAILLLGTGPGVARGQTDLGLEIREGSMARIPIHLEDFVYAGSIPLVSYGAGETPEKVLERDLEYSSFFRVTRGKPGGAGAGDPIPMGTRAIASGEIHTSWGRTVLTGTLRDGKNDGRIFSKDFVIGDPPDRWAIHAFADEIVLHMTGEQGVAQTRIAFVRDHGPGKREIHLVDYDGMNETQWTSLSTLVLSPDWSAQGDRVAYTSFEAGQPGVFVRPLAGGRSYRVSPAGAFAASPSFSPDGRRIGFTYSVEGNAEVFVAPAEGGEATRLTFSPAIDTSPTFSPDGSRIAFTSDRSGSPQVYVMGASGGGADRLTYVGKQCDSPDWSPRGDRIAFVSLIDEVFDICTMKSDGSDVRRLTAGSGMHENPRWAPDGWHIVFSKLYAGERRIYVMASDGSGVRALTGGRGAQYNPAWSPGLSVQATSRTTQGTGG